MSVNFTINTSAVTKKKFDSEKVKDEEKRGRDYKQFEIIDKKNKNQSGLKKKPREKCKNHYGLK